MLAWGDVPLSPSFWRARALGKPRGVATDGGQNVPGRGWGGNGWVGAGSELQWSGSDMRAASRGQWHLSFGHVA